ncbi:polyprenyl synthetase family protein [Mycolicibacterium sp. 018/SC-01/001]|uniref:polyprenyl synthetase family protein n=1 Tax=Mycolicibacterium sp. 018/SC-01/001 TaxID=2592069 RepID=UPI00117EE164|nr:polyprenyl synthetase family protein [Mycolicibacterium sp. 018/SC-01/001]TRW79903.1 polyprenyl synthetase family protein [Mycolicibacterium sp. 018/SC-01/001]
MSGARPAATDSLDAWRGDVRAAVRGHLAEFVRAECVGPLAAANVDIAAGLLSDFLDGGKYVRSTFMYIGWLCGAGENRHQDFREDREDREDEAAVRASASLELLHAFALIQDDVMDCSPLRRARPAAHVAFSRWHRDRGLAGSSDRFGESAAILLGDLCLVWAEQMLRRSGVAAHRLARVWPHYDDMRTELAIGQFADLVNSSHTLPTLEEVLDVLRRKSGNYTVRRPLEIGAVMAGCDDDVVDALSAYGAAIGEAFQLRDDLLGVFGTPSLTGKSIGTDLEERKATSVVIAAYQLAEPPLREKLFDLMNRPHIDAETAEHWRNLIVASGAVEWIEKLIADRHTLALDHLDGVELPDFARAALADMAVACTQRAA